MATDRPDPVEAALQEALGRGVRIESRHARSGGDISCVERLHTTVGTFVVKSHPSPPEGFFAAEAAGLTALRSAGSSTAISGPATSTPPRPVSLR